MFNVLLLFCYVTVMTRITENQRLRTVGMLQTGMTLNVVTQQFGVHKNIIQSLWTRFQTNGESWVAPRSGRPLVISRQQDN